MATAVLLMFTQAYQGRIVSAMIPALDVLLDLLAYDFEIHDITVAHSGTREMLEVRFNLARVIVVDGTLTYPMGWTPATAGWMVSLTAGFILQPAVMLLIVIVAWPAATLREFGRRLLMGVPIFSMLLLGVVTITLLAEFWVPIRSHSGRSVITPLLALSRFLMGGGALMLALSMAIVCIWGARRQWGAARGNAPGKCQATAANR